jgi:hypothetical protein
MWVIRLCKVVALTPSTVKPLLQHLQWISNNEPTFGELLAEVVGAGAAAAPDVVGVEVKEVASRLVVQAVVPPTYTKATNPLKSTPALPPPTLSSHVFEV